MEGGGFCNSLNKRGGGFPPAGFLVILSCCLCAVIVLVCFGLQVEELLKTKNGKVQLVLYLTGFNDKWRFKNAGHVRLLLGCSERVSRLCSSPVQGRVLLALGKRTMRVAVRCPL